MVSTITGAGGGGGKSGGGGTARAAQEVPDSLQSRAYARVIDLISEGEIEGLSTGDLQSVFLDQVPIMNSDGTYNFTGITVATRNGTQGQSYIPGFPDVENVQDVSLQIWHDVPLIRTITDSTYEAVRVTVSVAALTSQNITNGDISGTSVEVAIDISSGGGAYVNVIDDVISGKTRSKYERSYLCDLPGTGPWNIRVRRVTADSPNVALQNSLYWDNFTEITHAKLSYPNSAIVASVVDSVQFSSIPTRGFKVKLLRTKIPTNATVKTDGSLSYSGSWDGTFKIAWHANPAWCFYDMITTGRYGLGNFVSGAQLDKWTLYTIGQYCDQIVPDGFGGFEPRFRCNIYLQQQAQAFKVVSDMASIFRGMVYWGSGLIVPVQDAPADAGKLFSKSNVVDGLFTYSGTGLNTRHSVALVTWNDPNDFYAQKIEYVEDAAAILRYGVATTQIAAVGCTSRGQAHRVGKWLLYSEANTTETVSFKTGLEGLQVVPGQIISVQDADRAGARYSGRVGSATTTSLTVDKPFTFGGDTYIAHVVMPDGTLASSQVSGVTGNVISLTTPLPAVPVTNAIWAVSSSSVALQQFRVISVIDMGDGSYEISGLQYDSNKYSAVENNLILTPAPISTINNTPDAPTGVAMSESLYQTNTDIRVLLEVAWNAPAGASTYIISYAKDNGAVTTITGVSTANYEVLDVQPGLYSVSIIAVSTVGKRSIPAVGTLQVLGKTIPPIDVENFSLMNISDGVAHLTWNQATDLDVLVGGFVRIRWSPLASGASWANSVDIGPALAGSANSAAVPHVTGTYFAKFIDSSGYSSVDAEGITTNVANVIAMSVIEVIDEGATGFMGAGSSTVYDTDLGGIIISNAVDIDSYTANIDSWDFIDSYGGIANQGVYSFKDSVDLGGVFTSVVTASISAETFDMNDFVDAKTNNIDSWLQIDSTQWDDANATLYVRTTNDNPAGSPTWSDWRPFFVGQYIARAFQFQLVLTSETPTHNILISGLSVTLTQPGVTQSNPTTITSGTSPLPVLYPSPFFAKPAVGITAKNMQSGDYYTITSESANGFTIQFFNSSGVAVSRLFDYIAKGLGSQN
jgi:predicted phage tail protein